MSYTCPTNNCEAFTKDQITCVGLSGSLAFPVLDSSCPSDSRPSPNTINCIAQAQCSGWDVCNTAPSANVCQDVGVSNLVIADYVENQVINLHTEPQITLNWDSSDHGSVDLEVIYKIDENDTNPTILSTVQSTAKTATISLPLTLPPSPTAIIALRLASSATTIDTTHINATPTVQVLKCQ